MEKIEARLIQTTYASINMMFLAMNLLKLSSKGVILVRLEKKVHLFWCFCAGNDSLDWHKMSAYGAIFDNHLRTVFPYGANSVRFERLRMTF